MSKSSFRLCLIISSFINLFFLLLVFSSNGHCASEQSYFPMQQNENGTIPVGVSDFIISNLVDSDSEYYFIYGPFTTWGDGSSAYYYLKFDKDSSGSLYGVLNNGQTSFSLSKSGTLNDLFNNTVVLYPSGYVVEWNYSYIDNYSILNMQYDSSVYNHGVSYISNFDLTTDTDYLLLMFFVPVVVPEPSNPIPFDDTGLNLDSSLNASSVPSLPSSPSLSFDPLPTWDTQAPFESLGEIIKWGVSVLGVLLNAIITVIGNWVQFVGNLLSYLIQKLLDFIKAIINWLYYNFLNWLNPYLKTITFIGKILFNEDGQISIFDLMAQFFVLVGHWLGNFWSNSWLINFFTNLTNTYSTIQGYFEDLQSYFSKVALFFTTLVALGSDNGEFSLVTLFTALFFPSTSQVLQIVEAQDTYGFLGAFSHLASVFGSFVADLEDLEGVYKITLPSFTLLGVTIEAQDIDFTWYLPYKATGDGIISAFLIFGYLYWLFNRLSGILRGVSAPSSTPSELSDEYPKGSIIQRY